MAPDGQHPGDEMTKETSEGRRQTSPSRDVPGGRVS